MAEYVIKYWFEYGGPCLWSANESAHNKFGYPIENSELPISKDLADELYSLEDEYQSSLDWNYPPDPSPWTPEHRKDFKIRANDAYLKLTLQLGSDFNVVNEIDKCV